MKLRRQPDSNKKPSHRLQKGDGAVILRSHLRGEGLGER